MLLWLIYIFGEAFGQAYFYKKKPGWKPMYIQLFLIRGAASILHGVVLDIHYETLISYGFLVGFQTCSFWLIFDPLLNKLRDKLPNHIGNESGWLDAIGTKYSRDLYWFLKGVAFVFIFIFYIFGLKYFPL